ncbi:hypothetical protein MLD38_006798 [Melastoma candidum]|uniref:Uncharacterized protein n=1 Tax=Melastoma candidum TaxID=119954 RepID=A0ACB9RPL4_9MYRT|nr:hypothetical protein MLD38_006798 [Melastoma candidum]
MGKEKLILICQYGGEFITNSDSTLSYNGGDANAVDVNQDTLFNDLKLKLAEMFNLQYQSVSFKYFLPNNRQIPVGLANDKDLKRMFDFHANSVSVDVFVTGKEGFDPEACGEIIDRKSEIKLADVVETAIVSLPVIDHDAEVAFEASQIEVDVGTPADTVKKRRRGLVLGNGVDNDLKKAKRRKLTFRKNKTRLIKDAAEVNDHDSSSDIFLDVGFGDLNPETVVGAWKNCITGEGQEFKNVRELRDALQRYAIANHFAYKLKKNDAARLSAVCVIAGCSWKFYATVVPSSEIFVVKKLDDYHTCNGESWKAAHPAKKWLVSMIKERLRSSPNHKPKDIANAIFQDFGVKLNYSKVWRGIGDARSQLHGSYEDAYDRLPWFSERIVEANPGSFANLSAGDDGRFRSLFLSFRACIQGFCNGCRPILFLDSLPLKSKFHEVLLMATALDGDDGFFPVAFAIVDVEDYANWQLFLEQLKSAIPSPHPITFVSDSQKGLKKLVLEVFENGHHGYSIFRLAESFEENMRGPFHGDGRAALLAHFFGAARALRVDAFRKHTEQIKSISSASYDWIMETGPENWAEALFSGEPYGYITFDVAGLYDKWTEEARELPIIQKVEVLTSKLMELFSTRQGRLSEWAAKLTPLREENLRETCDKAQDMRVLISSETLFEVHDSLIQVVDLQKQDCSCLEWKPGGSPCCHAIAVFYCTQRDPYDYIPKCFTADSYRATYSESINTVLALTGNVPNGKGSSRTAQVLPPCTPKPPAEKKKLRKRELQRAVCCSRCHGVGHNKKTCKQPV